MSMPGKCVRALALCFLLLAMASPAAAAEKSIIIGLSSDTTSFDPQQQQETVTNMMTRHVYQPLVLLDAEGVEFLPCLATSWETAPDQVTWTFHLRKGVKFSDGSDFTAEDVKFTMERAPKTQHRNLVQTIKEIEVIDPHTLKVVTSAPDGVLLNNLVALVILNKDYIPRVGDDEASLKPMGTGPYILDEWVKEDHMSFSVNPNYWGDKPAISKVRFRPITNAATRTAALLSGEIDLAMDIPVRDVKRVEDNKNLDLEKRSSLRAMYMHIDGHRSPTPAINLPKNPMTDMRVRQAISLAIDRKTIVRVAMNNNGYPTGQMIVPGMRGYLKDMGVPEYNVEKARKLMKEAGYEKGFTVSLDAPNGRYVNDAQVAQAIASQLSKIGITVDLRLHPKSVFFDFVRPGDKSSLVLTGWAESVDAGRMGNVLFYTRGKTKGKGNSNRTHYSNDKFDALVDQADATADLAKRTDLLEQAMRVLFVEDMGSIPLYFEQDIFGKKKNVVFKARWDKNIMANEIDIK